MSVKVSNAPASVLRVAAVVLALAASGCGRAGVDTTYGRVRSPSVNGTGAFAGLLRERGHQVRTYSRLTDRVGNGSDVIVRFAPRPGTPGKDEAAWYDAWLGALPGRALVYVPRDYDAEPEYWSRVLSELPPGTSPRLVERVTEARDAAKDWPGRLPPPAKDHAPEDDWFAVESAGAPVICRKLGGEWAAGLDPDAVRLTRRQTVRPGSEDVLLSGDGKPLVVSWDHHNGNRVLVVANGSFLLNLPLADRARWPLAERVVDWLGASSRAEARVSFVEGRFLLATKPAKAEAEDWTFTRVMAQLGVLGLVVCLAAAPRLGRPRPEAPSGAERPAAHPEALGLLLARTGKASESRELLETYRRWRSRPSARGRREQPGA